MKIFPAINKTVEKYTATIRKDLSGIASRPDLSGIRPDPTLNGFEDLNTIAAGMKARIIKHSQKKLEDATALKTAQTAVLNLLKDKLDLKSFQQLLRETDINKISGDKCEILVKTLENSVRIHKNDTPIIKDFINCVKNSEQIGLIKSLYETKIPTEELYGSKISQESLLLYMMEVATKAKTPDKRKFAMEMAKTGKFSYGKIAGLVDSVKIPEQKNILNQLKDNPKINGCELTEIVKQSKTPEKCDLALKCGQITKYGDEAVILLKSAQNKVQVKLLNDCFDENIALPHPDVIKQVKTPEQADLVKAYLQKNVKNKRTPETGLYPDGFDYTRNDSDLLRIVEVAKTPEQCNIAKEMIANEDTYTYLVADALEFCTTPETCEFAKFLNKHRYNPANIKAMLSTAKTPKDIETLKKNIIKFMKYPDKYMNGTINDPDDLRMNIGYFINRSGNGLLECSEVFGDATTDFILRKRFDCAGNVIQSFIKLNPADKELLKQLINSKNQNGLPFSHEEKVDFITLIEAYKTNYMPRTKMEEMAKAGKTDLETLKSELRIALMKNTGFTDKQIASIPKERLNAWNTDYVHLLAKEIGDSANASMFEILRAGNFETDFNKFIHDTNNIYGKTNAKTREMFLSSGINYEKWLKPSKENETGLLLNDTASEYLTMVASQITEEMNILLNTPAGNRIKKQLPKFIKDNKFTLPDEYFEHKSKLANLLKILTDTTETGQLATIWNRAEKHLNDTQHATTAKLTTEAFDCLKQLESGLKLFEDEKIEKTKDLTIKMWDRDPQKDIFQGNYSTCCVAMGKGYGSSMPHYILNTAYNMMEVVDNTTGKTIGNALCYFVKTAKGKPTFIIDNIEINNAERPTRKTGLKLRDAITEYAHRVTKEITGKDDVPILLGAKFNDVPFEDLQQYHTKMEFLGDIDCDEIYMDMYGGRTSKELFTNYNKFLKLK